MCNELLELHSVLRLYCANYSTLHWNSCGEEFNDAHVNITDSMIDLFHKWIDPVGEMLTRLDINPLNYIEVADFIKNSSNDYFLADSKKFYNRKEIITINNVMLKDIVDLICKCLDSECLSATNNAGIKSELESMLNEFDLQYRYLNKRKLTCCEAATDVPTPAPEEVPHVEEPENDIEDNPGEESENTEEQPGAVCPECGNNPCTCNNGNEIW